jgi:serine kinase of HPr protein (carbohydrate metabolism regulator)
MLKINDLIENLDCKLLCGEQLLNRPITGGYACDLLSWVISGIKTDDVWLTILNSVNVIAVAVLTECSCVLLTENVTMDENVLQRAREKHVAVLTTGLSTFDASAAISDLIKSKNV